MADGKRDSNSTVVVMGVSSADGVTPIPLTCDPVTGRLRCVANSTDGGDANPLRIDSRFDGNGKKTALGVTDDADQTITPLSSHEGALMIQAN